MVKRVHMIVRGRVQGVGFRASTQRTAGACNLQGFVRNLRGGEVEIVAEGEEADLARLAEWARHGPPSAHVSGVSIDYADATHEFRSFSAQ
jgi:acylphosphatase